MTAYESIDHRRAIIDRRVLLERISAEPYNIVAILQSALAEGRAEVARRLAAEPARGRAAARATAYLHDQLVRIAFDGVAAGTSSEPIAIVDRKSVV